MNGNGEFNPDTWHSIQEVWHYWYTNARSNNMNHYQACLFASDQTLEKVSFACGLFVDATKSFGTDN